MRASPILCAVLLCACGRGGNEVPTWHRDVRSIVIENCAGCHTAGTIAPFVFESYRDVYLRRDLVRQQVESRRMPPWPPGPGCAEYTGDGSLAEKDRATLLSWLDRGAPEGDPGDAGPASTPAPAELSRADRTSSVC